MSRKRRAPKRKSYSDPKYGSQIISKFINSIMYDGRRSTAEKILYSALKKMTEENIKFDKQRNIIKSIGLDVDKFRENVEYIASKYPQVVLGLNTMHGFPTETE